MTSYIPPIDKPQAIYTLSVKRFDPERDSAPHWETYQVPWVVTMTVVEALEWLWDQGHYIAFRTNCREFTCGSCAMLINGKPALACDTPLKDRMRIEPLTRYPLVKDLVVDQSAVPKKWKELKLWPHVRDGKPIDEVSAESRAGWHRSFARCIECYICLDACPVSDTEDSEYDGPMWMLQIARARAHPKDGQDRLEQAAQRGIGACTTCYECEGVCPVNLSPIKEIQRLRSGLVRQRLVGRRPARPEGTRLGQRRKQ
ncbi:MAG: succinate dehydrogenase/fumarate reductase iron-sulfur subunit [Chloroflexi bacterium]|nr:succinate dehydrogenase/fumarate reductase iron-sulfur subunit [Chloroflexota bacterium]